MCVTIHKQYGTDDATGAPLISSTPTFAGHAWETAFVLDMFGGGSDLWIVEESCQVLPLTSSSWTVGLPALASTSSPDVRRIITEMMALRAYEGSSHTKGYTCSVEDTKIMDAFLQGGVVEESLIKGHARWMLTDLAKNHMRRVCHMGPRSKVFDRLAETLALKDCSAYELQRILEDKGFEWREWVSLSKRPNKTAPLPIGYIAGAAKLWYTTPRTFNKDYCIALCLSDELFEKKCANGSTQCDG